MLGLVIFIGAITVWVRAQGLFVVIIRLMVAIIMIVLIVVQLLLVHTVIPRLQL